MADCPVNTFASNEVGLSIAEEECIRQLPDQPAWIAQEPNSFSDFGAEYTKVMRTPINASRQRRKGRTVGAEASAGFQTDVTESSISRLMQGFVFADAREAASTRALSKPAGSISVSTVATTGILYTDYNDDRIQFEVGAIVKCSGFATPSNNGLRVVTTAAQGNIQVSPAMSNEVLSGQRPEIETCGYQYAAASVALVITSGIPALVATAGSFLKPGIIPGAWIFVGGDALGNSLGTNVGYARVKSVTATTLVLDQTTFTPVAHAGAGVSLRIFVAQVIRNENDPNLIKQRSYQLERTLGENPESGNTQAEYVIGAVASEFTLTVPTEEKLTADFSFSGADAEYRDGSAGDTIKAGARIPSNVEEEAFNSTSDIVRMRVSVKDATRVDAVPLTGYVQEATITINNNLTGNKAVGVFGNLDYSIGTFEVGGSLTAYFRDVNTLTAMKNDIDLEFNVIAAFKNTGFFYEMPVISSNGSALEVEADAPVTFPIELMASEGIHGFTLIYGSFPYLPDVAMPDLE